MADSTTHVREAQTQQPRWAHGAVRPSPGTGEDGFACTPHRYFQPWIKTEFALQKVNEFLFSGGRGEVALPVIPSRPKETRWLKNERSHPYKSKAYYILGPSEKLSTAEATPLLYLEKQAGWWRQSPSTPKGVEPRSAPQSNLEVPISPVENIITLKRDK